MVAYNQQSMQKQMGSADQQFRRFQTSSITEKSKRAADRTMTCLKNGKKDLKEGILQHCIRIWNKEKRSKNKSYAIKILNFTSKTAKIKEFRPEGAIAGKTQFSCFPPVVNLLYNDYQLQSLDQRHTYSDFKPKHLSNNIFRVKLATHKSKSTPEKAVSHEEVDELNINFKTLTQLEQSPSRTIDFPSRKASKLSQFYRVKLKKKQIRAIQVDQELIQNDFILSPW